MPTWAYIMLPKDSKSCLPSFLQQKQEALADLYYSTVTADEGGTHTAVQQALSPYLQPRNSRFTTEAILLDDWTLGVMIGRSKAVEKRQASYSVDHFRCVSLQDLYTYFGEGNSNFVRVLLVHD